MLATAVMIRGETDGGSTGSLSPSSFVVSAADWLKGWDDVISTHVTGSATSPGQHSGDFPASSYFEMGAASSFGLQNQGLAASQKVITWEDWTDNDYDDYYWTITATPVLVDPKCVPCTDSLLGNDPSLTVCPVNTSQGGLNPTTGQIQLRSASSSAAMDFGGFGTDFGVTPTWSNGASIHSGAGGRGVSVAQLPQLRQFDASTFVVTDGAVTRWFDKQPDGSYLERSFFQDTLTLDAVNHQFTFTSSEGESITFHDFDSSLPPGQQGQFQAVTDRAGNTTSVFGTNASGQPTDIRRTATVGGVTTTESYLYTYIASGDNAGLVSHVTVRRTTDGGTTWATVRQVDYTYYAADDPNGSPRNLKLVEVKDAAGAVLDTTYYRYYLAGQAGGYQDALKMMFSDASYRRLVAAVGSAANVLTASDAAVAPYADQALEYDSQQRVTQLITQGEGCSSCTGGLGTYGYQYTASTNPDGYNSWKFKTVETLPDGNRNTYYSNFAGQVMLEVFEDTATGDQWRTFYQYDSAGRLLLKANPSAVTGFDETKADLLNWGGDDYTYLADGTGLIETTAYYASTTATDSTAGGVAGYVQSTSVQRGETGTAVKQQQQDYLRRTAADSTIYVPASSTVYRNADGTGAQTTSYAYTWQGTTAQRESMQVSLPVVSAAQNGPGTADVSTTFYDAFGRPIWTKDADGFLTYMAYDVATGAVTTMIQDVDTTQTGDFANLPSGWTTPPGGGLHLITQMEVDPLGRTTKLTDPNGNVTYTVYNDDAHEVRTYRGWDASTNLPTGPIEVYREDRPGSYTESLTMSATPTVSGGRPTGAEAIANIESLSRSYTNAAGQVTHTRAYFSFAGLTYSTAANLGTEGTHYLQTDFAYDKQGRQTRVEAPDGTIHRTIYDGLDRVVSTWIGTNDTPASGFWSPTNNTSPSNMLQTAAYEYDGGGVGDGNLTEQTAIASATESYTTSYGYDWRNRMVDRRGPDRVAMKSTLDNLGQATVVETYADADADFTIDTSELRGKTEASFDEQGRTFQTRTYEVDQATGTIGDRLTSNVWFDHRGNLIKSSDANGLFSKLRYDGAGRATHRFVSYDDSETSWADADDVVGDTVIEQTESFYDGAGRMVAQLSLSRYEDDTASTGELAANAAYPGVSVNWYDRADRLTHSANYGRDDGGTRYVIDTSGNLIDADSDGIPDEAEGTPREPNTSDDYLVSKLEYDSAGRNYRTLDNLGRVREQFFDMLGRTTKSVANYIDGTPSESETDTDQTVEFLFDDRGRLEEQIAYNPKGSGNGVEQQSTKYLYESPINGSFVTSEIYPDSSDTTSAGTDQVKHTYDRLGRTLTTVDQRGVEHTYTFDSAGRALADAVTVLPAGVDGTIRRIERAYDDMGRLKTLTSYDAATGGNIVNQVEWAYNGWGMVSVAKQEHDGAVDGSTPSVSYVYDDAASGGEAKYVRLASVTYPDGREVHYNLPASGTGQKLARVDNIADDASGTNKYAQYQYVGSSMIASIRHPDVTGGLNLS